MRELCGLAFILAVLMGCGTAPREEAVHAFMREQGQCERCHETTPAPEADPSTLTFKEDVVALCEECHPGMVSHEKHPLDVRPDRQVPAELHLDAYYSITCATCHDPHGPAYSDRQYLPYTWKDKILRVVRGEKRHHTRLLRKTNAGGELCLDCHNRSALLAEEEQGEQKENLYVGSTACKECHREVYDDWKKTLHARMVGDALRQPKVVHASFEQLKPFDPRTLVYTLGQHWTQRYVVTESEGKDPMVRPEIWSIQTKEWISTGKFNRSWYKYCAGCHTTAFDPFKGSFLEPGIGCEACHGPGQTHIQTTDQNDIVNPLKLTEERRNMICEACHTAGHDRSGQYRFPVGYQPGDDLMLYYKGLVPKPGQETDTYKADGSYADRHRQFEFWISRYNIAQGEVCDVCKNLRQRNPETSSNEIFLSSSEMCATCHQWYYINYTAHAKHKPYQVDCIRCHPPRLAPQSQSYSIHDHRFQFGPPVYAEELSPEGRCRSCHTKKLVMGDFAGQEMP